MFDYTGFKKDPSNNGWVKGWIVFDNDRTAFETIFKTEEEARKKLKNLASLTPILMVRIEPILMITFLTTTKRKKPKMQHAASGRFFIAITKLINRWATIRSGKNTARPIHGSLCAMAHEIPRQYF